MVKNVKVAAYCRVSTNKDDQANSFESQKRYFEDYIELMPDWELHKIYADEGTSGTGTKNRIQFNAMIEDARDGKFRMILTKEVSRFSRNILDTIAYTRELRNLGIGVVFVTDRINTLEPESEMLLSFLASLAQEESRRTSTRVVWGQTRQMEHGVVFGRSMLGYEVQKGTIRVEPEGAETVRLIFHKYASEQLGTTKIARYLEDNGYKTYYGATKWTAGAVVKILKNEKYAGDLIQKKSYTPDYLTHKKKRNTGQVPLIRIENHHEPIISRQLWELTQARLQCNLKRNKKRTGHSNRYGFSGKIRCGECGSTFVGRTRYLADGNPVRRWRCGGAVKYGNSVCGIGRQIRDDAAAYMLKTAVGKLQIDRDAIVSEVLGLIVSTAGYDGYESDRIVKLRYEISILEKKKETMLDSYFCGEISREDMLVMKDKYEARIASIQKLVRDGQKEAATVEQKMNQIVEEIQSILVGETLSEVLIKHIVESLTVYRNRSVELRLKHLPHSFHFDD